jgi:CPA2 family monovalent cation:H+ antiporter-2
MDLWFFLMEMVMLLGGAFLLGALAQRMRLSPIVGYLLTGTIIGPLVFNATAVNQAAELGVSLLLFSIGLEFSFQQMRKMGRMALGGGTVQILATITIVTLLTLAYTSVSKALTIGAIIALSLVSLFSPAALETNVGMHMLKIVAAVMGLAIVFYILLYLVVPFLLSKEVLFANRELTVLLAISVGLGAAWAAHAVHISPALGAFVAGLLLGESPFATQIRADIGSLRIIMVTLFFASVGMLVKPLWFLTHMHWIFLGAIGVFILKTGIIYGVARLFGLNNRQAFATGIALGQIGEFSFVLANTAREGGVLETSTLDLIISMVIVLMLVTPFLVTLAVPMADRVASLLSRRADLAEGYANDSGAEPANRVLVVGTGPAGLKVVNGLMEAGLKPVVIEMNPAGREYEERLGIEVHLGDASHEDVLKHAGLSDVCMAVITIPDPGMAIRIVQMMRRLRPDLSIVARCRYHRRVADLEKAGADVVVDEESTIGEMLTRRIKDDLEESSGVLLACRLAGQRPEVAA